MMEKTKLEDEFMRVNNKLGEALNAINELEVTNNDLEQYRNICKCNKTN